jgi:hypothetical protein
MLYMRVSSGVSTPLISSPGNADNGCSRRAARWAILHRAWGPCLLGLALLGYADRRRAQFEISTQIAGNMRPMLAPSLGGGLQDVCLPMFDSNWTSIAVQ